MDEVSLPRWTAIIVLPLLLISTVLAACFGQSIGTNGTQILTILASTQAAIFAIVFSIIILGIQLSASRYSPRLVNLFREDNTYKFTTALFGASIGFDVLGLYLFAEQDSVLYETYLSSAGALAVGSLGILYLFVDRTLYRSTPEGILNRLRDQLSPEQTIQQARRSHESSTEIDPYQILLSVIGSAVEARDSPTVSQGLGVITERGEDLLRDNRRETSDPNSPVAESLEDLCTDRLPALIEQTTERNQEMEARGVIECVDHLGRTGIAREVGYVVGDSSEGLSKPIESLGYSEFEERIRKRIIDTNGELLAKAAEATFWEATDDGVRLLGWRVAQSIMNRSTQHAYDTGYTSLLTLCIPGIHSSAVEEESARMDDDGIDWLRGIDADQNDLRPHEDALRGCYFAMCEVTSAAIRYEIKTGASVVDWRAIASGWRSCLTALQGSNLESLLQLWLGTILYIEYLSTETDEKVLENFDRVSIQLGIREHINETVDSIQRGGLRPRMKIDFIPGGMNPTEMPLTGFSSEIVTDPNTSFSDWLRLQGGTSGLGRWYE